MWPLSSTASRAAKDDRHDDTASAGQNNPRSSPGRAPPGARGGPGPGGSSSSGGRRQPRGPSISNLVNKVKPAARLEVTAQRQRGGSRTDRSRSQPEPQQTGHRWQPSDGPASGDRRGGCTLPDSGTGGRAWPQARLVLAAEPGHKPERCARSSLRFGASQARGFRPTLPPEVPVRLAGVAYDAELADRIRYLIGTGPGVTEKKMFGGLAFLIGGDMAS